MNLLCHIQESLARIGNSYNMKSTHVKNKVNGINTWKLTDSSTNIDDMNFAISVDKVKEVFNQHLH